MNFNETNYRRLRTELLRPELQFNWMQGFENDGSGDGCVACACLRLEQGAADGLRMSNSSDIKRFLGCTQREANDIYVRTNGPYLLFADEDVRAAIGKLDEVAARYGVTPESSETQVRDDGIRDGVSSEQSTGYVSRSGLESRPMLRDSVMATCTRRHDSSEAEAAFLAQVRAEAREIRAAAPVGGDQ